MRAQRHLVWIAAVPVLLGAVVLAHQKRFEARCRYQRPPGNIVAVSGGLVHVRCAGTGDPLVLLEASELGDATQYETVLRAVARRTSVCAWDRPGMGSSPPTAGGLSVPAQGERILEALARIGRTGANGRIVTVGTSAGGLVSLYLARQHPERVVGVVLVDALTPEAVERFQAPLARLAESARLAALGARLGLVQFLNPLRLSKADACLTYWPEVFDAAGDLLSRLPEAARAVKRTPPLSRRMPLVVLRHGRPGDFYGLGISAEEQAAAEPAWKELQHSLAAQSLTGRERVIFGSGHAIVQEKPGAVVQAIDDVLEELAPVRFHCSSAR